MTPGMKLNRWLQEAHSIEEKLVITLGSLADDVAPRFPTLGGQFMKHQGESKKHSEMLARCLMVIGDTPKSVSPHNTSFHTAWESMLAAIKRDRLIKFYELMYATEQFEVAHYTSIIVLARKLRRHRIADMCLGIMKDEMRMADWLMRHTEQVVKKCVSIAIP